ncbi:MAG: amidohydrolase [Pseudomonadaceae bacterium]|nr:amidohydrolase [Pseudomonadaceae bacterium]
MIKRQSLPVSRIFLSALILLVPAPALAADNQLRLEIASHYERELADLFEHFHRNPELSNREFKTSKRLAREIRAFGYDVTEGVGGTGIVAVLENGDGPTVLIRADMDGLPIEEQSGLDYASVARQIDSDGVEKPVMHACGHDVHITALVATARALKRRSDEWSGTLVLVGQHAEERISGAREMLEDGLYERFPKPDYAIAFHVQAGMPAGLVAVAGGTVMSSSDSVDIMVPGIGTHGAYPHSGLDPVLIASQIVVTLQSVVSRTLSPLDPGVITVGSFHGGSKHNIIGNRVDLQLTVRADDHDTRATLLDSIDRVAHGVARSLGATDELLPQVTRSAVETTPPVINDIPLADHLRAVLSEGMGEARVFVPPRTGMGAEDFAYFVAPEHGVRGVYMGIGGSDPETAAQAAPHHSAYFKVLPEPSVTAGAEAMVISALSLFGDELPPAQ